LYRFWCEAAKLWCKKLEKFNNRPKKIHLSIFDFYLLLFKVIKGLSISLHLFKIPLPIFGKYAGKVQEFVLILK
jgi:hypothetical protein